MKIVTLGILATLLCSSPTLALDTNLTAFKKWNKVIAEEAVNKTPRPLTLATLQATLDRYKGYTYAMDTGLYNKVDYWASRAEFNKAKAGDCEDFAIAYYFDLVEAGFDESHLRLSVAFKKPSPEHSSVELHAMLEVSLGGEMYILDSELTKPQSYKHLDNFIVAYRINRLGWERGTKKPYLLNTRNYANLFLSQYDI
jgi:hypothetical protein